jgi:hypothetical protein
MKGWPICDCRQLGDQPKSTDAAMLGVIDVETVVIESRERTDDAAQYRHRMRVTPEALEEAAELFMHHGVTNHAGMKILHLDFIRQ